MEAKVDEPCSKTFTAIEADPQWSESKHRIHSTNSLVGEGLLLIKDKQVTCTGTSKEIETHFKVYTGGDNGTDILIECIGGDCSHWMLCVDPVNLKLSTRKKDKEYINFTDAEKDVLFTMVMPDLTSSKCQIKWKSGDNFIGFDGNGLPLPLGKVVTSQPETVFNII